MVFVSSLQVFYEMRFLYQVFIMLYTEDFSMRHYVGVLQIGSHLLYFTVNVFSLHFSELKPESHHYIKLSNGVIRTITERLIDRYYFALTFYQEYVL